MNTRIQGDMKYEDTRICEYMYTRIQGYMIQIHGYMNTRIPGYQDT